MSWAVTVSAFWILGEDRWASAVYTAATESLQDTFITASCKQTHTHTPAHTHNQATEIVMYKWAKGLLTNKITGSANILCMMHITETLLQV